jgi:hypothetical protein
MPGLPSDLHSQCRTVLLQCREFQDYRSLRSIFVTDELWPFRIGLQSASSSTELLDLFLDYILEQRLADCRLVFVVFLEVLYKRYEPIDSLYGKLEKLYHSVMSFEAQQEARPILTSQNERTLFDFILRIDFREQVRTTHQIIQAQRIASFLVHGEPDHGQRILVNRLLRLSPGWETGQCLSIDVGSSGIGQSIRSLWGQVTRRLGLSALAGPHDVAYRICEWLKTQDVIFIFHTVDYMPPESLAKWLQEFWSPVVESAREVLNSTLRLTRLLLFLVDYSGNVSNSSVVLAKDFEHPEYPRIPLQLPPASKFPVDTLDHWIDTAADLLPTGITTQFLLNSSSNGIPQLVYENICSSCGMNLEGVLAKWLK